MQKIDQFELNFFNSKDSKNKLIPINFPDFLEVIDLKGFPQNKIIEIKGKSGSGKNFLALYFAKEYQLAGYKILYFDLTQTIDITQLKKFKIDLFNFYLVYPKNYHQLFDMLYKLLNSNMFGLVIINSFAGILPISLNYNKLTKYITNIRKILEKSNTSIIFLNPNILKIYDLLEHYASLVIQLKRKRIIKKKEEKIGFNVNASIIKNNINFKTGKLDYQIFYKTGLKPLDTI